MDSPSESTSVTELEPRAIAVEYPFLMAGLMSIWICEIKPAQNF